MTTPKPLSGKIMKPTGLEDKTSDELQAIIFQEAQKDQRTDLYRAACREDQRRYRANKKAQSELSK